MENIPRDIFSDDEKLKQLCLDYFHHREDLKRKAELDPEQTPTPTRLCQLIKFEGEPLTIEEFMQLADFADNSYADWEMARLQELAVGFIDENGNPMNDLSTLF